MDKHNLVSKRSCHVWVFLSRDEFLVRDMGWGTVVTVPLRQWTQHDVGPVYVNLYPEYELPCFNNFRYEHAVLKLMAGMPGPLYTIYRVTSYLGLLALSVSTCNLNMSFLARPVYGQFQKLEKFDLRHCPPAIPRKKFCTGSEILFIATCASDFTFLPPLT